MSLCRSAQLNLCRRARSLAPSLCRPVLIGCIILPLTLLVIMLCWFLFGLSTSVALLTSDFCIDPSDHTTVCVRVCVRVVLRRSCDVVDEMCLRR